MGPYHPPYPGPGENVVHMKWGLAELNPRWIERAYFTTEMRQPVDGGRLGVFPLVEYGLGFAGRTEYMPRWEMEMAGYGRRKLSIEITGIVRDWCEGRLANEGVLLVYKGWPDGSGKMEIGCITGLTVVSQPGGR